MIRPSAYSVFMLKCPASKMIRNFLIKLASSAVAIWVADVMLDGFSVSGGIREYIVAGAVLGLLHTFIRPVLRLLSLPIIMMTLGLFTIVINAGLLWLTARWVPSIFIGSIGSLIWATIIISIIQILARPEKHHESDE